MKIVNCKNCLTTFRILVSTKLSSVEISHCPKCGSKDIGFLDMEPLDLWNSIGNVLGIPAILARELYLLWDIKEYSNFRDFVTDSLREDDEVRT